MAGSAGNDVIPPPPANASDKQYPQKIESLVSDISKLTLLEVADLNELLKVCPSSDLASLNCIYNKEIMMMVSGKW